MRNIFIIFLILVSSLYSFECHYCKKKIVTKYITFERHNYHGECYREHIIPKCAVCNKKIFGQFIHIDEGKYHENCYKSSIATKCAFCSKSMESTYIEDDKGKYHEQCYADNVLPKCAVCESPIKSKYAIDLWGNKFHPKHEHTSGICSSCNRAISDKITAGGIKLGDGRKICGICSDEKVSSRYDIEQARRYVLDLLETHGFGRFPKDIQISLKNLDEISKIRGGVDSEIRGFTHYTYTYNPYTTETAEESKTFTIYILDFLPEIEFRSVLAHEYLHVWLHMNDLEYKRPITEGFCNLAAALVYENNFSQFSTISLEKMQQNKDPDYGAGYRHMKNCLDQYGWSEMLSRIKNKKDLSCR